MTLYWVDDTLCGLKVLICEDCMDLVDVPNFDDEAETNDSNRCDYCQH